MTQENREQYYAHLRDLEKNYVPDENRQGGLYAESVVKARSKATADAMLEAHPELNDTQEPGQPKDISFSDRNYQTLKKMATDKGLDISNAKTRDDLVVILENDADAKKEEVG